MTDLISVIVPVYKVEDYLERCIDSILRQTYNSLEIILVDDGSPDRCGEICDEYAKKDSRIRVIHKENGGLSDARNVALDICKGEYISFIDSDDYISDDYFEYLYKLIIEEEADISVCGVNKFSEDNEPKNVVNNEEVIILNKIDGYRAMYYQRLFDHSAWAKLYKSSLFKGIRYPKGRLYEDAFTTYKVLDNSKKIVIGNKKNYYYLIRESSIMNMKFNIRNMDAIDATDEIYNFTNMKYPELIKSVSSRVLSANVRTLLLMPREKTLFKKEKERIWNNIKLIRKTVLFDNNARVKNRISAIVSYSGPGLLRIINKFK